MSAALQHPVGPYTVEDWLALDPSVDGSHIELIYGYLYVTPAPSGAHQNLAYRLTRLVDDALLAADRPDLYVATAVNVRISTAWRTALIPDLVILNHEPVEVAFPASDLLLAVEIWSPGNTRAERETKMAGYAGAGVPFVWTVDPANDLHGLRLTACRLDDSQYVAETTVEADGPVTITAGPIPMTLDLAKLRGRTY